ncbi:transglycosylase family protein [Macrococcus sp. EM39E]|uniref:transglycosylase family protein n=1 Tax=Macrococcus animalis TaxID=3395467 RepID=UPI0039BF481D
MKKILSVTAAIAVSATMAVSTADAASYRVKSGDSLWSIANKYGTSISAIRSANGLGSNLIHPNQVLKINGKKSSVVYKNTSYKKSTYKAPVTKTVYTSPRTSVKTTKTTYINRGLNWGALAQCESGNNPSINTGNGFYGMYQFDLQTWRGVGGYGYPHQASAAEQTKRAQILYNQRGAQPWPVCGLRL